MNRTNLNAEAALALAEDAANRRVLAANANPNMPAVRIASGRVVAFGHEVRNFSRTAVILGGSPCGDPENLVVQEVRGTELVPGNVWVAAARFCH